MRGHRGVGGAEAELVEVAQDRAAVEVQRKNFAATLLEDDRRQPRWTAAETTRPDSCSGPETQGRRCSRQARRRPEQVQHRTWLAAMEKFSRAFVSPRRCSVTAEE